MMRRVSDAVFISLCNRQAATYAEWQRKQTPASEAAMWAAVKDVRDALQPPNQPVETVT